MIIETNVTSQSRLAFIGLGYLGSRVARRLAAAGFPMVVYDRDREKTKELAALGATVAPNLETLAEEADVVLSCLPSDAAVKSCLSGRGQSSRKRQTRHANCRAEYYRSGDFPAGARCGRRSSAFRCWM